MDYVFFEWQLSLFDFFSGLTEFMVTPLIFGVSPLSIFSAAGFGILISVFVVKFITGFII